MKRVLMGFLVSLFVTSLAFSQAKEPQPTPPEKVVISYNLINAVAAYLSKQPYGEVEGLLTALKSGLSPLPVEKGDKKDETAGKTQEQSGPQKEKDPQEITESP